MARRQKRGARKRKTTKGPYRNRLESGAANQIAKAIGEDLILYEKVKIHFEKPATWHKYTPDFVLPNGIILETKGYMDADGRKKYGKIKLHDPNLDIRFVFSNANNKIRPGSKTTYGDWAINNGFPYADKGIIPPEWFTEPTNTASLEAIFMCRKKGRHGL